MAIEELEAITIMCRGDVIDDHPKRPSDNDNQRKHLEESLTPIIDRLNNIPNVMTDLNRSRRLWQF